LWNRLADFEPADLDAAFAGRAVVKATLMRITLHAVHADDYPAFRAAVHPTLPPALLGLSAGAAEALLPDLLGFADRPRTSAEMAAWLPEPEVWWALRSFAPLLHAPTGGAWSFGPRPSFVASGTPAFPAGPEALQTLIRRYLAGFGPASVADVAQFARVQRARVRDALRALSGAVEHLDGPDGTALFDVPGAPRPAADTPAPPRLMAMWDSILLAYADRSRVIPPDYRKLVIRANGDVLPALLVDGYVAGVWRPVERGIEATAFHRLPAAAWAGLAAEARALVALLAEREPRVYRRYDRWWAALPGADVRVLPG